LDKTAKFKGKARNIYPGETIVSKFYLDFSLPFLTPS